MFIKKINKFRKKLYNKVLLIIIIITRLKNIYLATIFVVSYLVCYTRNKGYMSRYLHIRSTLAHTHTNKLYIVHCTHTYTRAMRFM